LTEAAPLPRRLRSFDRACGNEGAITINLFEKSSM
jgi:hypothetical protein